MYWCDNNPACNLRTDEMLSVWSEMIIDFWKQILRIIIWFYLSEIYHESNMNTVTKLHLIYPTSDCAMASSELVVFELFNALNCLYRQLQVSSQLYVPTLSVYNLYKG